MKPHKDDDPQLDNRALLQVTSAVSALIEKWHPA